MDNNTIKTNHTIYTNNRPQGLFEVEQEDGTYFGIITGNEIKMDDGTYVLLDTVTDFIGGCAALTIINGVVSVEGVGGIALMVMTEEINAAFLN